MRVPMSWLRDYAPVETSADDTAAALIRAGLEVEQVERLGGDIVGVQVGEVLEITELAEFKKPIRYCQVSVGDGARGIVCGATNFTVGDRVPVALPGAVLPGGLQIGARKTYGHTSDGMICSVRELGIGEDHAGIMVLPADAPLGADIVDYLGLRDDVLDIAVTPDRGYCLSVRGVAREAATAADVPFSDPAALDVPELPAAGYPVTVGDAGRCARYVARIVRGVDPAAPSPDWLARRITLAGMRPISLTVDVTNYVLLALGQPLHAFDLAKVAGPIVVRRARGGERLRTLDGADRALDTDDLLITDDSGPIGIAGVMGGATTEIDATTRDVVVESAYFEPRGVARTAARHRLPSEAAKRFERGVDTALQPAAAELAVRLLVEYGGGAADPAVTDIDLRVAPAAIKLPVQAVSRLAGRDYPADVVRRRLTDVGCTVEGGDPLQVVPAPWRPDLTMPADLIEEVVRLEGYDTVPSILPVAPAGRGLTREQRLRRRLGRAVAAAGHHEVTSYPFLSPAVFDALQLDAADPRRAALAVANPVSEHESHLRTTLLPGLLASLARNVSRGQQDVAVYETGAVYLPRPGSGRAPRVRADRRPDDATLAELDAALPAQPLRIAIAMCGRREPAGHWGPGRPVAWADAVQVARDVCESLGAPAPAVTAAAAMPFHPGRCAAIAVDGVEAGHAGELHPRVVAALGLPPRTCAMELDLTPVLAAAVDVVAAPAISGYPPATVDVALLVGAQTPAAEVEAALRAGAGELLEECRLFDVYAGTQVGAGRRSLAFTLRFRAADRTLTDDEVLRFRDAAVQSAAGRTGAELRGT
ncbi:MAG TPA: phenylalanine--tRNA ligase subunit beta [Mycobacteriales bacterium]|nr:phenylalanine--tRNA ligase subunit beta [Mycobacteriales bacterium]